MFKRAVLGSWGMAWEAPVLTVPVIVVVDLGNGASQVNVSNNAGQTSRLKYYADGDSGWTIFPTPFTGNGVITGLPVFSYGNAAPFYNFQLVPYDDGSEEELEGSLVDRIRFRGAHPTPPVVRRPNVVNVRTKKIVIRVRRAP